MDTLNSLIENAERYMVTIPRWKDMYQILKAYKKKLLSDNVSDRGNPIAGDAANARAAVNEEDDAVAGEGVPAGSGSGGSLKRPRINP